MKKTLLILLLSISSIGFSQNYQGYVPFPTNGSTWIESFDWQTMQEDTCVSIEYRLGNDTIINGLTYYEIEQTLADLSANRLGCGPLWAATITRRTFGYLRNDSANKKVWLRFPNANQDTLFYDFDLSLGDTLSHTFYVYSSARLIVETVDTVFYGNRYRKRFNLSDPNVSPGFVIDFLIEGIGSGTGFAQQIGRQFYGNYSLDCVSDSGGTIYPDTSTRCNLITSLNGESIRSQEFTIFPNPTNGLVKLAFQERLKSIEIYNLQGQKVQEISPRERRWELPQQSGLYLIRLQDEKGNVYREKVIKN